MAKIEDKKRVIRDTAISSEISPNSELLNVIDEEEYIDLLNDAKIINIEDLAQWNIEDLLEKIKSVNDINHLVRKLPSREKVKSWIEKSQNINNIRSQQIKFEKYRIIPFDLPSNDLILSVQFLYEDVAPFILVISKLQDLVNETKEKETSGILIRSITKYSPITISISGIAETFQIIRDIVTPWRRNHLKEIAELEKEQKKLEIALLEVQVNERKMEITAKGIDLEKTKEEITGLQIQNKEKVLNLQREKMALCTEIIKYYDETASPDEIILHSVKLLPIIDKIISSNLNLEKIDK